MKLLSATLFKNFKGKSPEEASCWFRLEQDDVLSALRAKSLWGLREADELIAKIQREFVLAVAQSKEILEAAGAKVKTEETMVSSTGMDPFKLSCKLEITGVDEPRAISLGQELKDKLREKDIWLSLKNFS
jgi:hypothetical protein